MLAIKQLFAGLGVTWQYLIDDLLVISDLHRTATVAGKPYRGIFNDKAANYHIATLA